MHPNSWATLRDTRTMQFQGLVLQLYLKTDVAPRVLFGGHASTRRGHHLLAQKDRNKVSCVLIPVTVLNDCGSAIFSAGATADNLP